MSGGNSVPSMPSVAVSDACRFSAIYTCPPSSQIFVSSANTVPVSSLMHAKEFVPASSQRQSTAVPATTPYQTGFEDFSFLPKTARRNRGKGVSVRPALPQTKV